MVLVVGTDSIDSNGNKNDGRRSHNNFQKTYFNTKSAVKILVTE